MASDQPVAAAREGAGVLLVEPSQHLGGLMTSGLGRTDVGARATIGGLFKQLVSHLDDHDAETYGADSPQVKACGDGYELEPHFAEAAFERFVAAQPSITLWKGWRLAWDGGPTLHDGDRWLVETRRGAGPDRPEGTPQRTVEAVTLEAVDTDGTPTGERRRVTGAVFVDATYECDVALGAGAAYRIAREGREEFCEPHAGVLYQDFHTKLCCPGSSGAADRRVQAYNYGIDSHATRKREDAELRQTGVTTYAEGKPDDFLALLRDRLGNPSPLRQSHGVAGDPPPSTKPDAPITRADACRLLYAVYGPHL